MESASILSTAERSAQVALMRDICKQAAEVVAWLSEEDETRADGKMSASFGRLVSEDGRLVSEERLGRSNWALV